MGYIGNAPYQGVITGGDIADGTIEEADIKNDAVTTQKIEDANITEGKLADSAVTTAKIANDAVTDAKLNSTKLDGIETGATADQTGAEIKTAYEGEANTNAFTDAEKTKLSGIETGADVTDTANVTSAGALMDSEVTNLDQVKAFDSSDYATAAQGTKADSALQPTGDGSQLTGINTDLVSDTTPQLGGSLASNGNNISMSDGDSIYCGTSNDLRIFHSGSHSHIMEQGAGNLYIDSDAAINLRNSTGTQYYATFTQNGSVQLNYSGSNKITTTSTGVSVTGTVAATSFTGDGSNLTGIESFTKSSSDPAINTNGSVGDVWVNTTSGEMFVCTDATTNANEWINVGLGTDSVAPPEYIAATGGTVTTVGDYKIHTFTSSGTFTVTNGGNAAGSNTVEYLVVAGGGGSGYDSLTGGGGAGGYRTATGLSVSATSYSVTVGAGGSGAATQGSNSVFSTITSIGGGYGGRNSSNLNAGSGGSGGGAYHTYNYGTGTTGQGNNGGSGVSNENSGGGGGAGQGGGNATSSNGGNGGNGLASSISGTSTYYAGGGGGGVYNTTGGSGGLGGGGSAPSSHGQGSAGTANTGGGGGGTSFFGTGSSLGAAGGSGIVIIKYKYQ